RRYPSAMELRADLLTIQAGRSVRRQWLLEKRFKLAMAALVGLLVLASAGAFVQQMLAKLNQARLQSEAKAATAPAEEAELGLKLLQLEQIINRPRTAGWFSNAWFTASNVARQFGLNTNLQGQAAASLAGLDAKTIFETNGIGGSSVVFSPDGKR